MWPSGLAARAVDVECVVVPDRSIGSDQTTKFVMVADANGIRERRTVVLLDRHEAIRVMEGVREGEQVFVGGFHMAKPGTQVTTRVVDQTAIRLAQRWSRQRPVEAPVSEKAKARHTHFLDDDQNMRLLHFCIDGRSSR